MLQTLTVTDERSAGIPQPRIVSEDPLVVEIEFPEIHASVSMTIEEEDSQEQAVIKFKANLVDVLSRFMNQEVDYIYGAAIIESIRRLSTVIAERRRVNFQATLLYL